VADAHAMHLHVPVALDEANFIEPMCGA